MSYSTPSMVRMALVPSSNGTLPNPASNTAADLTDAQLTDAIAEADALIDSFIGGYYAVPVAAVNSAIPHPIDFWSRTIASYYATLTYRQGMDFTDVDPINRRYKDTLGALQAVSAGKLRLQIPENTSGNSATMPGQVINPYVGELWTPDDFSLSPAESPALNPASPFWGSWWT